MVEEQLHRGGTLGALVLRACRRFRDASAVVGPDLRLTYTQVSHRISGMMQAFDEAGLVRGDGVVAVGGTMVAATTQLLDTLITPGRELLTMITGDLATSRQIEEVIAYLSENHPDVEVEVHAGGQPLYPFLFGVE